jgi:hypothetical protein
VKKFATTYAEWIPISRRRVTMSFCGCKEFDIPAIFSLWMDAASISGLVSDGGENCNNVHQEGNSNSNEFHSHFLPSITPADVK